MSARLLILEDDPVVGRVIQRHLSRVGHEAVVVTTCAEVDDLAGYFHVGIFDIDISDGNGVEVARALLDAKRVRRVVFFSGTRDTEDLAAASRLGPVVVKTEGVAELLAVVGEALRRRRAVAAGAESDVATTPPSSGIVPASR